MKKPAQYNRQKKKNEFLRPAAIVRFLRNGSGDICYAPLGIDAPSSQGTFLDFGIVVQ